MDKQETSHACIQAPCRYPIYRDDDHTYTLTFTDGRYAIKMLPVTQPMHARGHTFTLLCGRSEAQSLTCFAQYAGKYGLRPVFQTTWNRQRKDAGYGYDEDHCDIRR